MRSIITYKLNSCIVYKNQVSGVYSVNLPIQINEDNSFISITLNFDHKPTLKEIGKILNEYVEGYIKDKILMGYTWNDFQVYLSNENQMTYKMLYDYSKEQDFNNLPITLKFGDNDNISLYRFENKEDFEAFYKGLVEHIYKTLNEGWKMKSITNWDILKDLLSLY